MHDVLTLSRRKGMQVEGRTPNIDSSLRPLYKLLVQPLLDSVSLRGNWRWRIASGIILTGIVSYYLSSTVTWHVVPCQWKWMFRKNLKQVSVLLHSWILSLARYDDDSNHKDVFVGKAQHTNFGYAVSWLGKRFPADFVKLAHSYVLSFKLAVHLFVLHIHSTPRSNGWTVDDGRTSLTITGDNLNHVQVPTLFHNSVSLQLGLSD